MKWNVVTLINRNDLIPRKTNHFTRRLAPAIASLYLILVCGTVSAASSDIDIVGDTKIVTSTANVIGSASGSAIQSARSGRDFHIMATGLPTDTTLQIELGFAELAGLGNGERVFDLTVNDKSALSDFDISAAAGGPGRSVIKKFTITPQQGFLDFHFSGVKGDASVNYIQISGNGVKKLISPPGPANAGLAIDDDSHVPVDEQAVFNVEKGTIELDDSVQTWNSGVPLGGIGTGKFEILPNGQFANFTINNSWDLPVLRPRGTFIAVAAKATSDGGIARLVQVNPSDKSDKNYYKDYPAIKEATFKGEFPFANWDFNDDKLPLKVKVEAWSPLIPNNAADSTLPGAVISVTLENPKNYPISSAVAFSWEDLNGRGGSLLPNDQHGYSALSTHQDVATTEVTGFQITSNGVATDRSSTYFGNYFVGTPLEGAVITRQLGWNPRTGSIPWWKQFSRKLRLDRIPVNPAKIVDKEKNGPMASTLCVSFNLAPKEKRRVPFVVSWYFPKIVTLDSASGSQTQESPDYSKRFGSSASVASYIAENRSRFRKDTTEWTDMIAKATVPQWLKSHALNSLFPMHSNSIYLNDNRFAMLEAPADMKGMLGPVDLRMSADDFILSMFPDLEKAELNLYARAQNKNGRIPRYIGNIHGALSGFDLELLGNDWVDPTAAWILQVAAYWRETADEQFKKSLLPAITNARDFLKSELESGKEKSSINVFSSTDKFASAGSMTEIDVLAALKAADHLIGSETANTDKLIADYLKQFSTNETTSTFAAMLAGDYALRRSGLGGIISDKNAASQVKQIITSNYSPSKPVPRMEADGGDKASDATFSFPTPLQSYVGALGLSLGLPDAGLEPYLRMFQIAYAAQKAPWKQALRYDVPAAGKASIRYHRSAMAAWSIWRSLAGVVYDQPNQRLYINPQAGIMDGADLEIPVFTPAFWGWLKFNEADSTGTLAITHMCGSTTQTLLSIATGVSPDGSPENLVKLSKPFLLEPGETIEFKGWPRNPNGVVERQIPVVTPVIDESTSAGLSLDDTTSSASAETTKTMSSPETAEGEEMSVDDKDSNGSED